MSTIGERMREFMTEMWGHFRRPITIKPRTLEVAEPPGGWDNWYEFCFENVPKAHVIVSSIVEHVVGFTFERTEEGGKSVDALSDMVNKAGFDIKFAQGILHWLIYGRTFFDVDFERDRPAAWIKVPNPRTIRILRNVQRDIKDLKEKFPKVKVEAKSPDDIVGFFHTLPEQKEPIYFAPDELIFIPRYPIGKFPNGISVFHSVWTDGVRKIAFEVELDIIAARRTDPRIAWRIGECPPSEAGKEMVKFVRDLLADVAYGEDYVIPDWVTPTKIEAQVQADLLEKIGKHIDEQFISGMGGFQAMISGEYSNRATAETQERFFQAKIMPIRERFEEAFMDPTFRQYLDSNIGEDSPSPKIIWRGMTPLMDQMLRDSLSRSVSAGVITPNDARIMMGLSPVAEGNILYRPVINVVQVSQPETYGAAVGGIVGLEMTLARALKKIGNEAMEEYAKGLPRDAIIAKAMADASALIDAAVISSFWKGKEKATEEAGGGEVSGMDDADRRRLDEAREHYVSDFKKILVESLGAE